jgi:myb proto-oncogene protein
VNADPITDMQLNAGATTVARRRWTSEEDATLTSAVVNTPMKKWGKEYKINWDAVAALVPSRTRSQCKDKWYQVLNPRIVRATGRKGRWTADEDKKLKDAVQTHGGKNWGTIAALVPGRTTIQCSSRWHKSLGSQHRSSEWTQGKWSEDEDSKLKDAVQTHGGKNWGDIAALVPGRSRIQCRSRWQSVRNNSKKTEDAVEVAFPLGGDGGE